MLSIQTNYNSLVAQQNLSVNSAFQSRTIQRLTSGYRINSSADDAAGLAVANKYRSQTAELTQGVRNGNDGLSQLQIMDGGMNNISQMLDRLKTLSMQSASASFTGDRATLNSEFQSDVAEIDRQAQSIGLNIGGAFAKSLGVYLGAGSGSQTAANSVVSIDLTKSTVDSTSLGLTSDRAISASGYDLGSSSNTSVAKIIADANNQAQGTSGQTATFKFFGQGYTGAGNAGLSVTVNLGGVTDTASLATAINNAITNAANGNASFKAAGITASIVTDSKGNQELAFDSKSAFQVAGGNNMANALMGNFNTSGVFSATAASGQSSYATFASATNLDSTALDCSTPVTVTFKNTATTGGVVGGANAQSTITLSQNYANAAAMATDINTQIAANANLKNAGISASVQNNRLVVTSSSGAITVSESDGFGASAGQLGLNTAGGAANSVADTSKFASLVASGAYQLGTTSGSSTSTTDLNFASLGAVAGTQKVTVTASDATGKAHSLDITLPATDTTTDKAVESINTALQNSGDSTLQQITAVLANDNGTQNVNLMSNLSSFSLSVNTASVAGEGVGVPATNAADATSGKLSSVQVGAGGSVDISTMQGAQSAVTAVTQAVSALGNAQAAIGKGQNQLNYAIGLAQSQITNFSSAEAQIRDTDVAAEAANLSKAQVLQQASIAAMAQANSAPQAVLSLLRG
jgi:flagellin